MEILFKLILRRRMFNLNLNLAAVSSSSQSPSSMHSPRVHFLNGIKVKLGLYKVSKQVEDEISKVVNLTFAEFKKNHNDRLNEKKLNKVLKDCLTNAFTKSVQTFIQKQKKEVRELDSYKEIDFASAIQTETFLCNLKQKLPNKKIWVKLHPFLLTQLAKIISPATAEHVVQIAEETANEVNQSSLNCQERVSIVLNKAIDKVIQDLVKTKLCLVKGHFSFSNLAQMPTFIEELQLQIQVGDSQLQPIFPFLEENLQKKVDQLLLNKLSYPHRTELIKMIEETRQALLSDQNVTFDEPSIEQIERLLLRAFCEATQETLTQLKREASEENLLLKKSLILFSTIAKHPLFLKSLKKHLDHFPHFYQVILSKLEMGTTYKVRRLITDFHVLMENTPSFSTVHNLDENQLSQLVDRLGEEEVTGLAEFKIKILSLNTALSNLDPYENRELSLNNPKIVKAIKKLAELPQKQRVKGYQLLFTKICDLENACKKLDPIEDNLQSLKRTLAANATGSDQNIVDRLEEMVKTTMEQVDLFERNKIEPYFLQEICVDKIEQEDQVYQATIRIHAYTEWIASYNEMIIGINSALYELRLPSTPRSTNKEELSKKYEKAAEQLERKVAYIRECYLGDDYAVIQKELRKLVLSFLDGLHSSAAQLFKKQNGHLIQQVQAIGEKRNFLDTH